MLSITAFPRRFITASKRSLLLLRPVSSQRLAARPESWSNWYTSDRTPLDGPGLMPGLLPDNHGTSLTSLPLPNLANVTREQTLAYLDNTWALTDELFSSLQSTASFTKAPAHGLRHPMVFYYGHPTVFYINKLRLSGVLSSGLNAQFEELFEVGVDEMSWDDMSKNEMVWPAVPDITNYRRQVYQLVKEVVLTHPELEADHPPITQTSELWGLFMAFEHDRIHIETSSVLLRELPLADVSKPRFWPSYFPVPAAAAGTDDVTVPVAGIDYPTEKWVDMKGGVVSLGKPLTFPSFGWDNEYGHREIQVKPFSVSQYMVTNGDFLQFIKAGGYQMESLWSAEGWQWKQFRNTKHPTFWKTRGGPSGLHQFNLRVLFDEIRMPWDWPVEVNHLEAQAYCRWKEQCAADGSRYQLTTEAIHHLLREETGAEEDPSMLTNGQRMSESHQTNLNLSYASCSPVTQFSCNSKGISDATGNAWELCEDFISPLNGFQVHPIYEDFTTPCFDGRHTMILGGSFNSSGDNGSSKFSRYHFRQHFHQHSGFRLVKPLDGQFSRTSCHDLGPPYPYHTTAAVEQGTSSSTASQYGPGAFDYAHVIGVNDKYMEIANTTQSDGTPILFNVLDALEENASPDQVLNQLQLSVRPGGILIIGTSRLKVDELAQLLTASFDLVQDAVSENNRDQEQSRLQTTAWRRR